MDEKAFHVYIMANDRRTLYTGVTSYLAKRVFSHKEKLIKGFTKKYHIHKLVHYEQYETALDGITREKEIKGWLRKKKTALIEAMNPEWKDLSVM